MPDANQRRPWLHVRSLAAAEWVAARNRVLAGALVAVVLASVAINQLVLEDFPNSGDEYVYLYQASTYAQGQLWNPAPAPADAFRVNYIAVEPSRAYGTFPPGWPLLLAAAMRAHLPLWLVNPLLGAATLWLVAVLGARLHDGRVGIIAAALIGITPFFLFNAASYFSHTLCGALLVGAACLAARPSGPSTPGAVAIGFLLAWAVVTRYFTGIVCALPVIWLMFRTSGARVQPLALTLLGALPWVVALMAYNQLLTGHALRLTTPPETVSLWFRTGMLLRSTDILSTQLLRMMLWTPPLLVVVYLVALWRMPRDARAGGLNWMLVIMAAALYAYVDRGGNQYGPRYYYEAFLFATLFTSASLFGRPGGVGPDESNVGRWTYPALALSVAAVPMLFVGHAFVEHRVVRERTDPFRMATEGGLRDALVLIGGRVGNERSISALDLARNLPAADDSVLYGLDLDADRNCRTAARFPSRRVYRYSWDPARSAGALEPLDCPANVPR